LDRLRINYKDLLSFREAVCQSLSHVFRELPGASRLTDETIMASTNHNFFKTFFLLPAILFLACTSAKNQSDEVLLAQIGEKEISVREFLHRSELAVRPNNFKNKNTTLNNIIAEKILAGEAECNNKLLYNPVMQGTLKGIKEQLMRDKLHYEVAVKNVEIDSHEVVNAYKGSMREYELEFYTIQNTELAKKIRAALDSVLELSDEIFQGLKETLGKKPVHKVNYKDLDDEVIHESLFAKPLDQGTVIGPFQLSNGDYFIMKVLNWVDYPLISGEDQRVRWKKVKEKIHQTKANRLWRSFQTTIMKGKRIEFNKQSFYGLSNWAMAKLLSSNESDSLNFQITEIPSAEPEINLDAPFFTIDNKLWTVGDFKKELMSHPLVFRTKYLDRKNFHEQLKFAIVDMMMDHYLTQEAYKRSLDRVEVINKTVEMWKDAYLAIGQQKSIINSALAQGIINENDQPGIRKYWKSYLLELQKKYSNSIRVNYEALDKLSLTNIDYVAIRPGVPYPIAVPTFPTLVLSANLDYAKQKEWN